MKTNATNLTCRITKNGKLGAWLNALHERLYRKYPVVIVITGEVGTGKSKSLLLNILDYWYKEFNNKIPERKFLTTDLTRYSAGLKNAKPMEFVGLDEAIDAFGKGTSDRKIVNAFTKMFGICRGRQVATAVVLDDIFLLTTKLAKYVTTWIHASKRVDNKCKDCDKEFAGEDKCPYCGSSNYTEGVVLYAVYSKKRLRDVLTANENKTIKTIYVKGIKPNFKSLIHEYRAELENYYNELKYSKQEETMDDLIKEIKIGKRKLKEAEKEYAET